MRRAADRPVPEWLKNKRDDNEREIVETIRGLGADWRPCSRHEGHDGWVVFRQRWYPAEIKNPARRWELTEAEKKFMQFCERNGVVCYVLETPQDVVSMLEKE